MIAEQKRILVTGGARRIGAAFVRALADSGWSVVLHYNKNAAEAATLASELGQAGALIELVQADLSTEGAIEGLITQATQSGPLTALVNNASLFDYDCAKSLSLDNINKHMAVNLGAPALLIRALYEQLPKGRTGSVVNMLDAKLFGINPDYYSYTLSKAACHTLTLLAAQAYAPRLRVNAIAPGIVLPSGGQTEAEFKKSHKRNLLGQGALIPEIVAAMQLLLQASSMTGEVIILDGGAHLSPPARDVAFLEA